MSCYELPVSGRLIAKFARIPKRETCFFVVGESSIPMLMELKNKDGKCLYNPKRKILFGFEVYSSQGTGLRFFTKP